MFPVINRQAPIPWQVRSAATAAEKAASDDLEPQKNAYAWSQKGLGDPIERVLPGEAAEEPEWAEKSGELSIFGTSPRIITLQIR